MSLTLGEFKKGNTKLRFNYNSIKAETSVKKIDLNVTQKRRGKPIIKAGTRYRTKNLDIDTGVRIQGKNDFSVGVQGKVKW